MLTCCEEPEHVAGGSYHHPVPAHRQPSDGLPLVPQHHAPLLVQVRAGEVVHCQLGLIVICPACNYLYISFDFTKVQKKETATIR